MKQFGAIFNLCGLLFISRCLAVPFPANRDIAVEFDKVVNAFQKFMNDMPSRDSIPPEQQAIFTRPSSRLSIPQEAPDVARRAAVVAMKRDEFTYGEPLGGGPSYPSGTLGFARNVLDWTDLQFELVPQMTASVQDGYKVLKQFWKFGGLRTMQDYVKLYDNQWMQVMPKGPNAGFKTNYTSDLLFSMGRLSYNPFSARRLDPAKDTLNFEVDDNTAISVAQRTMKQLLNEGRLFYIDHRNQKDLPRNSDAFAAAADAYFYIHPKSGDFLPLAIRTNVGANLIYTPKDLPNDWMLAKMIFNVNDFWFDEWNHYTATHEVVQNAYVPAIRTMSNDHPVMSILNRLMYQIFSFPPVAKTLLFTSSMVVDHVFPFTGPAAEAYCDDRFLHQGVGRFQANYFRDELRSRGMIDSKVGPELKHFPFYEDGAVIFDAQRKFFTAFVDNYYPNEEAIKADTELQAWADEANGPAKAQDFPKSFTKEVLVDTMTHFAHLGSTLHHAINTNNWIESASVLPLEPASLYKEIPTTKGIKNPADWLPPLKKVLEGVGFGAFFARPQMVGGNRTVIHMFDDADMLAQMGPNVTQAANEFKASMIKQSTVVGTRTFDDHGLCQGMPFIWNALDPTRVLYSVSI